MFCDHKRKEGIYQFNYELLTQNKEPKMRERITANSDKIRLCVECHEFFSSRYFYKHKCVTSNPVAIKPLLLKGCKVQKIDNDKDFQDILNRFHDEEVGDFIRQNQTIQMIGYKHYNMRRHEEGKEDEVRKVVMSDMRELTRLYLTFKDISGEKNIGDMFERENLQDLADAIERMVCKDWKEEKHCLKLLLDAIILRSVKTLRGYYSEIMEDEKCKNLKLFLTA